MLQVQTNSRQMPSIEKYTADKKYNDILYGTLQEMSYAEVIDGVTARYVNKGDVAFATLGNKIGLSRQVTSTKFKNLISLGLIEYVENEKRYKLNYLDKSISALVPFETLRKLNNSLSQNSISLFIYLLKRYIANGEQDFIATMSQMKKFIGVATNTTSNNDVVNDILHILKLIGLVETELRQLEDNKTVIVVTKVNNVISKC